MNKRIMPTWFMPLVCAVVVFYSSCSEALPPYEDPRDILDGKTIARYVFSSRENTMSVNLIFTNEFDETLEGKAVLAGQGTITWARDPNVRKTFTITPANLTNGKFNPTTSVLTMDPGDSLRLNYRWNFIDDTGMDLRQDGFLYFTDPTCSFRKISYEETFIIRAEIKVFERIGPMAIRLTEFTMCHVTPWVSQQACPSISTDAPCGMRR